jgi:AcrR family transcriptional regulator
MARLKSPEKRSAILEAAVHEIAEGGLAAPTAKIAQRAGLAGGTLFTYFANKEELLNELYFELKTDLYRRVNSDYPPRASLEQRARRVWLSLLDWAIEFPEKRKVSLQLNVSDVITPETRARVAGERSLIDAILAELEIRSAIEGLPPGFASAVLGAMQETTIDFMARHPKRRKEIGERGFQAFWRALR